MLSRTDDQLAADRDGQLERVEDALGDHLGGRLGVGAVLQAHGELVAAEAGDHVAGAHAGAQALRDRDQQLVPDGVAERVVDRLEVVDVDEQHRQLRARAGERVAHAGDEQRAVRQVGQRVVEGLVAQLLLEVLERPDRLLEPVVLQRDAGVVGQRLEQLQVVGGEVAHDALAVGEHERADHAVLAGHHRQHRPLHAALAQVGRDLLPARGVGQRHDGSLVGYERLQVDRDTGVDGLHDLLVVARPERRPQRRLVGRPQDDLGALGAERVERSGEQLLERLDDLRRAAQPAVGLVEELEPLAALALGDVGAVGEEDGEQRHQQQRQRPQVRWRRSARRSARCSSW